MLKVIRPAALAGFVLAPVMAQAAASAPAANLDSVLAASGVSLSGYIDASFTHDDGNVNPGASTVGPVGVGVPGFGAGSNDSFSLNQVAISIAKLPASGVGAAVTVIGGHDAPKLQNETGGEFDFAEAYLQYATGDLTIKGGKFTTLAGAEVINSTQDMQATRSLLFNLQPLTLTGLRAGYNLGPATVYAGVVNNAASGSAQDVANSKTIEVGATASPIDGLNLAGTYYSGNETEAGFGKSANLLDFVGSYQVTKELSVAVNFDSIDTDLGSASLDKITGLAGYVNYQLMSDLRLSGRAETVTYKVPGTDPKATEVTLTAGYAAAKNLDVLAEFRSDKIDDAGKPFVSAGGGDADDALTTYTVKAIYKF